LVLDLIITKSDDGVTAEIPSIKGCESWAHGEEEAIDKTLELFRFYMKRDEQMKIKIDLARREGRQIVYKIVFDK
jgi:predicted RNase H-like HicB family nuclease